VGEGIYPDARQEDAYASGVRGKKGERAVFGNLRRALEFNDFNIS
jgi:hypothetical protein